MVKSVRKNRIMAFKIGNKVDCLIQIIDGRKKLFFDDMPTDKKIEKISCEIISINRIGKDCDEKLYMISIPDDVAGWMVTQWRIKHQNIDKKYLNKKFHEVNEYFLNREVILNAVETIEEIKKDEVIEVIDVGFSAATKGI